MKKIISLFLCISLILCSSVFCLTSSATDTVTLLNYSYTGGVTEGAIDETLGSKSEGYVPTTQLDGINARLFASVSGTDLRKLEWSKDLYANGETEDYVTVMTGGNSNLWGSAPYFLLKLNTVGYENISFSAKLGGTKKGPRDYKLQYSTDGETFNDVQGATYTITDNKEMQIAFDNVSVDSIADSENVYIRIIAASESCINNGDIPFTGSSSGDAAITDITVVGTAVGKSTVKLGDVDGDGNITVSDVVSLRKMIMDGEFAAAGDMNKDDLLTVSDVVALRQLIMSGGVN